MPIGPKPPVAQFAFAVQDFTRAGMAGERAPGAGLEPASIRIQSPAFFQLNYPGPVTHGLASTVQAQRVNDTSSPEAVEVPMERRPLVLPLPAHAGPQL
jgi:hypothetical protein